MKLQELELELVSLTPDEKVQAIQILSQSLGDNWPGIQKTSGVIGGDACIRRTRIPVWLLVSYRHDGATDSDILQDYPDLSAADLVNAFSYANARADEIEAALQRQDEEDEEE